MKKILLFTAAFIFCANVFGQRISKITIAGNGNLSDIVIGLDENVQVYLSKEGQISKWGYDRLLVTRKTTTTILNPMLAV